MKTASEYRQHAQECRELAATMPTEAQCAQLLRMAEHWENFALDRIALIERHPEIALAGEREEERSWKTRLKVRAAPKPGAR